MTSLLEGKLKAAIAKGFKGKLTKGTIRREGVTAVNSAGDPSTSTVTTYEFEGIRESYSAIYKARADIPIEDVRILVLLGSVKPATNPRQGDLIYLKAPWNTWHKVRTIPEIDPAGASARCQAYEVPAP